MAMVISELEAALLLDRVLDRVAVHREDVMIERPHSQPVVLLALDDYLALTAALTDRSSDSEGVSDPEGAEIYSLETRRRHRDTASTTRRAGP